MSGTVRIVRLHGLGGPEVMRIDTVPMPEPGPSEVRIRVGAIGLNRIEAVYRAGGFGAPPLPAKIGYEAAGIVDGLGAGANGWAVGDRVAVLPGVTMPLHGTYGEMITCPADMLVAVPDALPDDAAAATWMQYLTAYALVEAGVGEGDHVLITAAASSVGLAAIQIVRAAGGIPIATTRSRDKADRLAALGAAHVIVGADGPALTEALQDICGSGDLKLAFDAVAGANLPPIVAALARGGQVIVYGALAGGAVTFDVHALMLGGTALRGYSANQVVEDPTRRAKALAYIADGLAAGHLRPVIDRIFALDEIADAHLYLEGNAQVGKIIVRP